MTDPSTITTVEELPEPLREELVAKRQAGTTLAELKKAYPQVAADVIRAVLPPLPKGTEPKPAPRKPRATKPTQTAAKPAATRTRQVPAKGKVQPAANGTDDKARMRLAAQVVQLREEKQLSWLKIGAKLELAPEAESAKAGASRARTLYKLVKGADADTGPLNK
jgi:hypothetical protein